MPSLPARLPPAAMYGAGKRKRARAGSAGSEGDPLSPLDAKRAPSWAGEHDSFMFSPTHSLSPFPECTATEERHGSMMPPTPRDGSGRPPTPRGNSLGEGCRPATPYVPSPARELSAYSPVRERAHSTSRAGLREGSLDRSAFLESPDRLRSELLEVSSTSALNQSRAYHLEESLVLAKSRSERYERELVSEMDRSCALAGKAARLEEANSALKEELSAAQAKAGAQERRVLALEAQAAAAARNIPSISAAEAVPADPGATSSSEQLHTAQTALLHAQRDLALANIAAEDAKSECTRLAQRLQAAEQRAEEASAARAPAQAGGGETVVSATDPQHGSCCCKFCLCASAKPPPPMAVLRTHRARPSVCPRVSLLHVLSLLSALCASNVFRRSSRRR